MDQNRNVTGVACMFWKMKMIGSAARTRPTHSLMWSETFDFDIMGQSRLVSAFSINYILARALELPRRRTWPTISAH